MRGSSASDQAGTPGRLVLMLAQFWPALVDSQTSLPPPSQQTKNALRHHLQPETHLEVLFRAARDRPQRTAPRAGHGKIGWPRILGRRLSNGHQSCEKAQEYQGFHVISFAHSRNVTAECTRRVRHRGSLLGVYRALQRRRGYLAGRRLTGRVKER